MWQRAGTTAPGTGGTAAVPAVPGLWISMLGPLAIRLDGRPVALGPLKQQLFLAALLARGGRAVSLELLTETIWPEAPPRTARKNLQVYASTLRKMLGPGGGALVEYGPGGYLLRLDAARCDAPRFTQLAREAARLARSGEGERAAECYRQALDLWADEPLAPLAGRAPLLRAAAERWHERHLEVYESWAETRLAGDDAEPVAATVAEAAARHPLRERLRVVQLRALQRAGRRSEALAVYDDFRRRLSTELGLAPGAPMERAYRALLADEPAPAGSATPVDAATVRAASPAGPAARRPAPRGGPVRLPPPLEDFTGREALTGTLLAELRRETAAPVVLSAGPGGGASALAVQLAHRLGDRFPDGRVRASCRDARGAPRPWESLLAELARALGSAAVLPAAAPSAEAAAAWRGWLADHRVLLLLDDAADAATVAPLFPDAGPSRVLLTARDALPGVEPARRHAVPGLTPAEGVRLLGRIITPERTGADPAAARRIVTAVDGVPLAVRIAGRRLALLPATPLGDYADRLARPEEALDALTAGTWRLRDRLARALGALPTAQRTTIRALGALPAPRFTLTAAARALGRTPPQAVPLLEELITAGLLAPAAQPPAGDSAAECYELPRLTWLHAREQLTPTAVRRSRPACRRRRPDAVPEPAPDTRPGTGCKRRAAP